MTKAVHVVVGPEQHGVCRHGVTIAEALGHRVVRIARPEDFDSAIVSGVDVIHIPYTDRLFAEHCEDSAKAFLLMAKPLLEAGQAVSVTVHDLPAGESELELRRQAAYAKVVSVARGVVVNSNRELGLLDLLKDKARSRRRIPLPVEVFNASVNERDDNVVVLGFIFPNRGYEHTLSELPEGVDLLALGGPSAGHEDLPAKLSALASQSGHLLRATGFVPDEDLAPALARAGIPVAPNRRVAASASIATWIGHGRRPLVPDSPYTREISAEWPGTVILYDADVPGALRTAVEAARAEPALTYIDPASAPGPSLGDVASAYSEHFDSCTPDRIVSVSSSHCTVPANRWDLLGGIEPQDSPRVSVVIPYFEAQSDLDRVLGALSRQTYPMSRLQVVVADDGSKNPPDLGAASGLQTALVRQKNQGFRAAAARNLGAATADGEVLLFLDGDTSPEPDYVQRMSRLPALAPDMLVVGRRRHADFKQQPPVELEEPSWLVDVYKTSGNLLDVDERSYRFIISAVMGMHRDLFTEIAGFTEKFDAYGGEDWELAHRAYVAGAVFAHIRDAVAWHDGPDWGARTNRTDKNIETFSLSRLLPDTVERGGGQWFPYPALAIQLQTTDAVAALATVRSAFSSGADCGFWIDDAPTVEALSDPRVRTGTIPPDVLARATVVAELLPGDLADLPLLASSALSADRLITPAGIFTSSRSRNRVARWRLDNASANALFGTREQSWPIAYESVDLHHELTKVQR